MGKRNVSGILVGTTQRKTPLESDGQRWEYDIKMYLMEIGWSGLHLSGSGKRPVECLCKNCNEF
jgi:hypothetical protein